MHSMVIIYCWIAGKRHITTREVPENATLCIHTSKCRIAKDQQHQTMLNIKLQEY